MMALLSHCELCPRRCGADRLAGQTGICGVTGTQVRIGRAALHAWEEPCIAGTGGAGAVFFTGCSLRCVYCQNEPLSRAKVGGEVSVERLAHIFIELQDQGAHTLDLVTPTHYTPHIIEALKRARRDGLHIPAVYNCSGYERVETLRLLQGYIQIYMPDVKYPDREGAAEFSGAPDYPDVVWNAVDEMVRQTGAPVFDQNGILQSGTLVRHLVLPERTAQSMQVLDTLHERYGDDILISLMSQYTPMPHCTHPDLQKPVPTEQYERLVRYAQSIGITNAYVQQGSSVSSSFIPSFNDAL